MTSGKSRRTRRLVCEPLESRALLTAVAAAPSRVDQPVPAIQPVAQVSSVLDNPPVSPATPQVAAAAKQKLAKYLVGNWVHTIGSYFGTVMQVRQVWQRTGTYLTQMNYRTTPLGVPYQVPWYTVDRGTWKATTGTLLPGVNGVVTAKSTFPGTKGLTSVVYVNAVNRNLADFGVLPSDAKPGTRPVWLHYARMV